MGGGAPRTGLARPAKRERALRGPAHPRGGSPTRWRRASTGATRPTSSGSTARGLCEHFASGLRGADARATCRRASSPVTRADPLPVDDYLVVRQSDAHAWAEVLAGRRRLGARRSTAARWRPIASSAACAARGAAGLVAGALGNVSPQLARPREAWRPSNKRWNQWVLNYSRGQQFDLLKDARRRGRPTGRPSHAAGRRADAAGAGSARPGPGGTATGSVAPPAPAHRGTLVTEPGVEQPHRHAVARRRVQDTPGAARGAAPASTNSPASRHRLLENPGRSAAGRAATPPADPSLTRSLAAAGAASRPRRR